ncbi:uncharacterized protein LOC132054169 [Lycium ferocissimum]|uniref:uncharacterized protein LOC132054169 n=1 Tax=Lycium ferocissimum TaxID=112874 RepID=UPI0028156B30|nr:uncharacterized protein LOC132054169 [Lycium ferocissimum]
MIQHPESAHIDPLENTLKEEQAHCSCVEVEPDGRPWYVDIKTYLEKGEYPPESSANQRKTIRRLTNGFFLNKEVLYKRTPDLGLLRCVDAEEATKLLKEVHPGACGPHMNGFVLAKKILGQELHAISSPWPFVAWGMDVIGPIEPPASNGHRFILVAIDYFTKWMEATSHKSVTKKVVADFVRNNLICHFGVPESIITDNGANLNSHLMKDISEQCKITHRNSTAYRPQMNRAVEAASKNIKRILRKMVDNYKKGHEQLPYALLGYRTTTRTSIGATPYLLVYGTEAVIPAEVEIPSLRIIQEAELKDAEWVKSRYEQLAMIEEKRMVAVCHGRLYRQRMSKAFNKRVRTRLFQIEQLVLKRVFPHQEEYKGNFAPNWQGTYMVRKILSGGAVVLAEMDGQEWPKAINADALKRYYV